MPAKQKRSNRHVPCSLLTAAQPEQAAPFLAILRDIEDRLLATNPTSSIQLRILHLRNLRRSIRAILNGEETPAHRISVMDAMLDISQHPAAPALRAMRQLEDELTQDPHLTAAQLSLVYQMRTQRMQIWSILLYGGPITGIVESGASADILPDANADDILDDNFGKGGTVHL